MFGAAIGAGASLLGGFLATEAQERNNIRNQENFEKQLKESRRQFDMNFRQQSIYNQLQEQRAGGLNPAAANVGVSSSPSSSMGTQLPNISPAVGLADALGSFVLRVLAEIFCI